MRLKQRLKRQEVLKEEGWPKTLTELFERTRLTLDNCAHLCVDNQNKYMDSESMYAASDKINNHIAPAFNSLGISTYWIVWPVNQGMVPRELSTLENDSFQEFSPLIRNVWPGDIDKVIPKNKTSAFERSNLEPDRPTLTEKILEKDQPDILFVSGFFADACLKATAEDACDKGYLVVWLEDGSHIDDYLDEKQRHIRGSLSEKGVLFMQSEDAIAEIKKRSLNKPKISI